VPSFDAGETPRRSTSSLGVTVRLRAFTATVSLLLALTACHREHRIVRMEVYEDHVSVDGVRSDLPIQQAVDARTQSSKVFVLLVPQSSLSAAREAELRRCMEKIYMSSGITVRRVDFGAPQPKVPHAADP
jgi:hypothetical protein